MFLVGSALPSRSTTRVGANVPIDVQATDRADFTANNSPSLVRNPRNPANLAVANRIDAPQFSCALHLSFDGGARWQDSTIPFPAGEELPARCFAPSVVFGPAGTLYLSFVTLKGLGNSPNAVWVTTSDDGGRNLSTPRRVTGPRAFQVRLTADPLIQGRLYLSWLLARSVGTLLFPGVGNPIVLARSDDGGATWSKPVRVNAAARARVVAPSTAVGPGGILYLLYLDLGNDRLDYNGGSGGTGGAPYPGPWSLVLARSIDGGVSWNETAVDPAVVPTTRFVVFLPPVPSLAVDPRSGTVYVAFTDGRLGDADVLVWRSTDQGASFGTGHRVNDTRRHDGSAQYLPQLSVAPNGRLDVVYYDRRADAANVFNEVSLQSSYDGGATFTAHTRLSDGAFDSRVAPDSIAGLPDLGNRLGLVSTDDAALAVWTDTRAGTPASGKQDIAGAVVEMVVGSPWRDPLRDGGLGLLAVAVLVGISAAFIARHRTSHGVPSITTGVAGEEAVERHEAVAEASPPEPVVVDAAVGLHAPDRVNDKAGGDDDLPLAASGGTVGAATPSVELPDDPIVVAHDKRSENPPSRS